MNISIFLLIISTLYISISIVIELINIFFLLTPSDKDDSLGFNLLEKWESVSGYVKWFSIRTPILFILEYILKILVLIRKKLQVYVVKKREKNRSINTSNKINDAH